MFRPLNKGIGTVSEAVSGKGGNDALLKALQDARLDEWTALRLLHENTHPGVQGYICNRLPELGEALIERYLLQLVYLAVHKPGQQLERILLTLCKHSFRVAIKAQWLLLALCQDHPKSRALESFRDQAYKAALEGKWEVPIRTAKLDPLSPHTSQQLSPPFCSPTNSYMVTHLAQAATQAITREMLLPPPQPYRPCYDPDDIVATQPPGSMVMSPPGAASGAVKPPGGDGGAAPAALQRKRSGALVCLLPAEQHVGPEPSAAADKTGLGIVAAAVAAQQEQQLQAPKTVEVADGAKSTWLDSSGVAAFAPVIKTSVAATTSVSFNGVIPTGNGPAVVDSEYCAIAMSEPRGPGPVATSSAISAPVAGAAAAVARVTSATATTGAVGCPVRPPGGPSLPVASITDRIQALKRELGEGEGVSALLERAKQQGMAPVAAMEDDAVLSDDELSNRPMSPLSRLRFDTFGATLDFVETLCDASSSLTSYSQGERQNALRDALEHINHEIERANRREVAIWFPMGRRGDRVLRLSAREAVLLNSREKAPFMLFVEVLEGQNECGEEEGEEGRGCNTDAFAGLSAGADLKTNLETLGGIGPSASMTSLNGAVTKLEFGRRETYGIALTGIGAQHQLHYMHATPAVPRAVLAAALGAKSAMETGIPHGMPEQSSSTSPDGCGFEIRPSHGSAFAAAAAVNGPVGQPNGYSPRRSDVLISPMPIRAPAPVTQASLLEEQAALRSAVEAEMSGAVAASADGPTGHCTAGSADISIGVIPHPALALQPAVEIVIPTRSASNNNIAAAVAAAMAASASGGTVESILASARSSEAGALAFAASSGGAAGGGTQPATPRSCSSLSGLPPRPPSALTLPQPQQQPPVVPVGGISPVNAAKEVSGQEGGGLLGASNLLRRVFGDREETAPPSSSEDTGGAAGILRAALDGKFGIMEVPRWGTIASAAAVSGAPASLSATALVAVGATGATTAPPGLRPSSAGQRAVGLRGPESAQHRQCPGSTGAHPVAVRSVFANPLEGKMQELGSAGFFGAPSRTRAGPEVMAMLSDISASLRGEMPMVRVRIVPVGPSDAVATAAAAAGGNTSGCGPNGQPPTAFSLATLGSRAKAALLNQQPQPQPATAASEDAAEGGQSKTALLLSRLGWCRKPAAEDDGGDGAGAGAGVVAGGSSGSTAATAPIVSSSSSVPLGGGASQVTIPVTSGGILGAKRLAGRGGGSEQPPLQHLVRLVLTVATQGVNLDIKSPHRKSRRMPSHEAIEMMADKYKIYKLPPPPECGPPLGPYRPYGSNGAMDQLYECTSDEGEGKTQSAATPLPGTQLEAEAETDAKAKPYVCAAREVPGQTVESAAVAAAPQSTTPPPLPAAATKTVVLGAPLPPEWESRHAYNAAARSLPIQVMPSIPGASDPVVPLARSIGARCGANGPEALAAASAVSEWWKSGPTAVAEAANSVDAAAEERVRQQLTSLSLPVPGAGASDNSAGNRGMCLPEKSVAMEAGGGGSAASALPATSASSSSLAASLQSSLTRILNRSAAALPQPQLQSQPLQQPQVSTVPENSLVATCAATGISSGTAAAAAAAAVGDGAGQPKGPQLAAPLHSGTTGFLPAPTSAERQPSSAPAAQGLGQGRSTPDAVNVAMCVDAGSVKAEPPSQRTSGVSACEEVGPIGAGASAPASSSGLTGSLQSSLFSRILSRTTAAMPLGQQQPSSTEVASGAGGGGGNAIASGSTHSPWTAPRGVSPVRGGGSGGDSTNVGNGSQPQAPASSTMLASTATAAAAELPAATEGIVKGPVQQRVAGSVLAEGGQGAVAQASSSGLAASLQSSLTRILNRGPQQPQLQPPAAEAAAAATSNGNVLGRSPRGGSPIRLGSTGSSNTSTAATAGSQTQGSNDAAAAAAAAAPSQSGAPTSTGGSRLSKFLSRVQHDQQQPLAIVNQNMAPGQQQLPPLPHQQPNQGQGRPAGMQQGCQPSQQVLEVEPAAATTAAATPTPQSLPYSLPKVTDGRYERESLEERRRREAQAVYGERWAAKVKRIQRESPHGRRQGWALRCVIVKSGDDCRQELLALQLVRLFGDIFAEAGLPLWVRYYEVLVTSNKTALIEMVPNTLSIHTIKSRSPPGTSLSDHFFAKFGRSGTSECTAAQRRFTESLAAYSLICYLLQIKDRHNGNILIDDDGRVVHIDYGFLLSNSPGGVNFESAPFKLTRELLEVMDSNSDGRPSEMFDYFKVLMIQGFIAVRNCSDRIMLLVKIMSKSGFPCFKGGERALKALEKRLMSSLTEVQCVEHVLHLIAESLDAWRTRQYDYYQRVLNGIL